MEKQYISRDINSSITDYLHNNIHQIQNLDYFIEEEFSSNELTDILIEDLTSITNDDAKICFINDICQIAKDFFHSTQSKSIRIQILKVTTDKCRLFHADYNVQRLLCTYLGPGTEWLEESNVNYKYLGKGDNEKIVKSLADIKKAKCFDIDQDIKNIFGVILFKSSSIFVQVDRLTDTVSIEASAPLSTA